MTDLPTRPSRRAFLLGTAGAAALTALPPGQAPASAAALTGSNPLMRQRADPHVSRHTDGLYYATATVPEYDRLVVRRASTLQGLATAAESVVWTRPSSGDTAGYVWAPELHFLDGRWHLYFSVGTSAEPFRQRIHVLRSSSADPRDAAWTMLGRVTTAWDTFSLDATTFTHGGVRYLAWAQSEPGIATNSNLYLSRMASPTTLTGPQTRLTVPSLDWETRGYKVAEGPSVLIRNGRVFLTYSASATDANYCLGMLTASASANLLDAASWTKSPTPVFASSTATSQYGPGHNGFTTAPDGSDVLIYHARGYRDITGDPLFDPNRHTRAQKLYYNADGTPNFGVPVPDGPLPVRLRSANFPDRYVRHHDYRLRTDPDVRVLADSQFRLVTGLAGSGTVSLESINFPGRHVRARADGTVHLDATDGTSAFAGQASFRQRAPLTGSAGASFESAARAGQYLRHQNHLLVLGAASSGADAVFVLD
jgi:GH43 family beta-xylosidase